MTGRLFMKFVYATATFLVLMGPNFLQAAPVDFVPRLAWFGGDLEFEGIYTSSGKTNDGNRKKDTLYAFRETLNLETIGYVYHPRLMFFEGEVSGELVREMRESEVASGDSAKQLATRSEEEYDLTGTVFGAKPYNMDFHVSQKRPFLTSGYSNSGKTLSQFRSGVTFNYKKKPLVSALSYDHFTSETSLDLSESTTDSTIYTSQTDLIAGRFRYGTKDYNIQTRATHSEVQLDNNSLTAINQSQERINDRLYVTGIIDYEKFTFLSVAEVADEDGSDKASFQLKLQENINGDLPWNMDTSIRLYYEKKDETDFDDLGEVANDQTSENNDYYAILRHRLFDSVTSYVSADYIKNTTITSSRVFQTYTIDALYTKELRRGKVGASLRNELTLTEQQGIPRIIGERHDDVVVNVGDTFTLNRSNADVDSIDVEVFNTKCSVDVCSEFEEDPAPGGEWQVVPSGQWEVVDPSKQFLEIRFLGDGMGGGGDAFDRAAFFPELPVGPYKVRVSYTQPDADYIVQANSSSLTANLTLFDKLLSCYYDHSFTTQKYVEGDHVFGELSPTVNEDEIGITVNRWPLTGSTSYRMINSDNYDEQRWVAAVGYRQGIKLFHKIAVNWGSDYRREELWAEDSGGTPLNDVETFFLARLGFSGRIPWIPVTFAENSSYTQVRGGVFEHRVNADGVWESIEVDDEDDKDNQNNRINFRITIPYANIDTTLYTTYNVEKNLTNQTEGITRETGLDAERTWSWVLGATTISLTGRYNFEMIREKTLFVDGVERETDSEDDEFELLLEAKRPLF